MQELQREMTMRLQTLDNQIARCQDDRDEHVRDIAKIDREIERFRTLHAQYQQVLDTLPSPA